MTSLGLRSIVVLAAGVLLWETTNLASGTREPWDSPGYWAANVVALALSAMFGHVFIERPWRWATIVVWAQLPVIMVHGGIGPLLAVGLIYLAVLSLPAIVAAIGASRIARRVRPT